MKFIFIALLCAVSIQTFSQESSQKPPKQYTQKQLKKLNSKRLIQVVFEEFSNGKYDNAVSTLDVLQARVKKSSALAKKIQGLIYYWRAMSLSRMNDFEEAEKNFIKALELKYKSKDIYYEYGQVLYVSLKYKRARIAFKKSVRQKYKMGVSLYYIAYISQELKDYKKAVKFYNMIEKLPKEEKEDVIQAARMQIGDIYLKQVEKRRDPFNGVKQYVIPQYETALAYDEESKLADDIRAKILNLQRKYELILFRMRNGKPTARPPYFVKANILYGQNNNITTLSEDDKEEAEEDNLEYASAYYDIGLFTRYSFYPSSSFSYAPELSFGYTKYQSASESILPYNKYFVKTALKMNYEHLYNKGPATFYIDLDYKYTADDADADESFAFANNTYGLTLSEELQFWKNHPSTFRFRYETVSADEDTSNNNVTTLTYEQVIQLKRTTIFLFNSYGLTRYPDAETSNTNTYTFRVDFIFPTFYKLFNPTLYTSMTNTTYVENDDRGVPSLRTYGLNLSRPVGKGLFLTLDYSSSTQTADEDSDNYDQQVVTLNLDYIY